MKNLKYMFIFLFITFMGNFVNAQGFHTSTTKVEYENGELKLIAKFFTNDLEKAVGTNVAAKAEFDRKVSEYSNSHLIVSVNGNKVPISYIGSQTSDKSTRIYFKVDNVTDIREIEVNNSMLIDVFNEQQNLVTFDVNGVRKSFTARKGNSTGKVNF